MYNGESRSKIDRILESVPALSAWLVLTSPVWLGIWAPNLVAAFITFLSIYWVYLTLNHTLGAIRGYRRYSKEIKTDWFRECEKLDFAGLPEKNTLPKNLEAVKHFLLIPAVNESLEILDTTLKSISDQNYKFKDSIYLVITCEERGAASVRISIEKLKEKYKNSIRNILFYVHPQGIPGELVGGGAPNRSWGARHTVSDLQKSGVNLRDVIFTTFDADTSLHKEFLARLTHSYLTCDERDNHFYSTAVFLFNNNIADVHTLMRIEADSVTLGILGSWTNSDLNETFSCYSVSLDTLISADYWDISLIDDTVFFWRAFFARGGNFKPRVFYIPNSSDAVHGETILKAHTSLYKQLLRWGWGSVVTPLAFKGFLTRKDIPALTKLRWTAVKIERHFVFRTIVFLLTFGLAIMSLVNEGVRQTTIAYNLPNVISLILTLSLVFLIPNAFLRYRLTEQAYRRRSIIKKILLVFETPLVFVNLLTFSFIPFLEAETKMMLGLRYKSLHFTPKYR